MIDDSIMNSTFIETTDNALKELLQFNDSNCPSNEMKKSGDLLIAFQKKKKKKCKKAQWYLHLNKTFNGFTTDFHTQVISLSLRYSNRNLVTK